MFNFHIPEGWETFFKEEMKKEYFQKLMERVEQAYDSGKNIFPEKKNIFAAFEATKPENIKVVIMGQDPYHEKGQANGLSFSVNKGVKIPPSLRNIFKEMNSDLGIKTGDNGDLSYLAKQGVFLLNATLTVEEGKANSHKYFGWETFTDNAIKYVSQMPQPMVFILWGMDAQKKIENCNLVKSENRLILKSPHPSPLSANRGFFGSKPFSKTNIFLFVDTESTILWNPPTSTTQH